MLAFSAAGAAQAVPIKAYATQPTFRTAKDVYGAELPQATAVFTTLDNPGDPTFNQLLSINDSGIIAGYFGSGAPGHLSKAYYIKPPYRTFVNDNVPTSTQTQVQSLTNNGTSSGFWSPSNTGTDANLGFIEFMNGATLYLNVNDPLTGSFPVVNQVLGIIPSVMPPASITMSTDSITGISSRLKPACSHRCTSAVHSHRESDRLVPRSGAWRRRQLSLKDRNESYSRGSLHRAVQSSAFGAANA